MPNPPTTAAPVLNANTLRKLAESADGQRDQDLAIFWDTTNGVYRVAKRDANIGPKIADIRTPMLQSGRTTVPDMVQVKHLDGTVHPLLPIYDAIFWSESSIEKFVIPYYTRLLTQDELAALWRAHASADVYAILHMEPSIYETYTGLETLHLLVRAPGFARVSDIVPLSQWARANP